jgi:uncharacterized membrane protein YgcG
VARLSPAAAPACSRAAWRRRLPSVRAPELAELAARAVAALAVALCAIASLVAAAQEPIPPLAARVTDLTATLTQPQRAALEEKLAALETRKGAQLVVLIVATSAPE